MNLALSDFRGVLGKTNDGNVVMKQDQSGIEKANYGSFLGRIFTKVRKAESNPENGEAEAPPLGRSGLMQV